MVRCRDKVLDGFLLIKNHKHSERGVLAIQIPCDGFLRMQAYAKVKTLTK